MDADKEQKALKRIELAHSWSMKYCDSPIVFLDSGGKDSAVIVELAKRSGLPFKVVHNHTTADAPETVRFVRKKFKQMEQDGIDCAISYPIMSMWELIPHKRMPPTRLSRYCCSVLKESYQPRAFAATGVRWAESANRSNNRGAYEELASSIKNKVILNNDNDASRQWFDVCALKRKHIVNPIIDWTDRDVWDFIADAKIEVNPLYGDCGFGRVGCIGCPMAAKHRYQQFARWPKYEQLYRHAFQRMLDEINARGLETKLWNNADDVWHWWMEDGILPGQMELELEQEDDD